MNDKLELETLDYRPPGAIEKPASAPPEVMGFNSVVIKPEARINKIEDAGQPLVEKTYPLKEPLKDGQKPICGDKCEQPNLKIIEEIEALISQVRGNLDKFKITSSTGIDLHSQLCGGIYQFKIALRELKKVVE